MQFIDPSLPLQDNINSHEQQYRPADTRWWNFMCTCGWMLIKISKRKLIYAQNKLAVIYFFVFCFPVPHVWIFHTLTTEESTSAKPSLRKIEPKYISHIKFTSISLPEFMFCMSTGEEISNYHLPSRWHKTFLRKHLSHFQSDRKLWKKRLPAIQILCKELIDSFWINQKNPFKEIWKNNTA